MKKRLLCLLLALALLLPLMAQMSPVARAIKQEKKRAIGIVFDNSGSMYGSTNSSWCRATYAMEVFASMMNDGDQLQIYPMWPISLGAGSPEVSSPLVINGPEEASIIRQIYTPLANTTPFSTVEEAYEGLMATQADEKYLIVLTDGVFDECQHNASYATERLSEYSEDMHVMFLAIGNYVQLPDVTDASHQYYDKASDSSEVTAKLTEMCNRIFGRDELKVSGSEISFDVSMSKLIVFIQGEDVSGVQLSGASSVRELDMQYGTEGCGNDFAQIDYSLQGVLVTYKDLPAGDYQLSYSGDADSVKVYYEPDVDLQIRFQSPDGKEADITDKLYSGDYTLTYTLVDKNGKPTSSSLLGDVNFDITYTIDGEEFTIQDDANGSTEITLPAGAEFDGSFAVRYLNDYTIQVDGGDLGWPLKLKVQPVGDVTATLSGGQRSYDLSALEQQAVYRIEVAVDGQKVTGEDLNNVTLDVVLENGNAIPEIIPDGDGFQVTLKYNGDAANTKCGDQAALFTATYTNVDGESNQSQQLRDEFEIEDDSASLKVQIRLEQSFYVISQLADSEPIVLELTCDGKPLSAEQFAAASAEMDLGGIPHDIQPDPANSRFLVYLKGGDSIDPGVYDIRCTVNGVNSVGSPETVEDTDSIELQNYPLWLRILFWVLLIGLIVGLIWAYLNAKVLPKKMGLGQCSFIVGGKVIPGTATCSYSGGGKKRGTLEIKSPKFASDPAMKCSMRLELEAASPRRVRSSQRSVRVIGISPGSKANTTKMQVGATTLVKNSQGQFVKQGTKDNTKVDCGLSNNTRVSVSAVIMSPMKGKKVTVSLNNLPVKFY